MTPEPPWLLRDAAGNWLVRVWAQPGARCSEIAGEREGCLKIRLAAPAVENKANKELAAFVAACLGIRTSQVRLLRGEKGRDKILRVDAAATPDWSTLRGENTTP